MEPHKDQGGKAGSLSLARHSLTTTFSKRRPFSRKPSSWRHPGGTVSETEETDFSECDETAENTEEPELHRRKPSHVHSFTFSSLSMFRSKQRHSSGDGASQLSFEGSTEETRPPAVDCLEIKQITSPARSPNRKFKEATDKVRDNLRAYAQRFKENRERGERGERDTGRSELTGARSASAGREETIEEETTEDVEAERSGVTRASSLNCRQITKPLLQSHSSTESTDVPTTPRTSPTRTKKKLSLKNRKSGDVDPNIQAPYKRNVKISKSETPKKDNSAPSDVKDRASQSPASQSLCLPPPPPSSDFALAFPEVFRQAIQEVDSLTEKCVCEGEVLSNDARTVPDWGQEVMTDNSSDETGQTGLTSERRCYAFMAQCQAEDTETGESEEEDKIRLKSCQTLKKWSPGHSEQLAGQRSRQGSKRRRKKETGNTEGKINSPQLTLKITSSENRRASDTSLPQHSLEQSLPSSPSASSANTEPESRSPQIIFTGSSTLPRSTSEHRRLEQLAEPASTSSNQTSVLTLQLEGPYGCAMSICDGNSREDTISPMVSQKTGDWTGPIRVALLGVLTQLNLKTKFVYSLERKAFIGMMICFSIKII